MTEELNYEELRRDYVARLFEDGRKVEHNISKTKLWYWSVERNNFSPELPKGRKFVKCDEPRLAFYKMPPLNPISSDTILVVTTNYEGGFLSGMLDELVKGSSVDEVTDRVRGQLLTAHDSEAFAKVLSAKILLDRARTAKVERCSRMADFWSHFFGVEEFMDEPSKATKPQGILTTGLMRTYGYLGGCTDCVKERLEEIGRHYNIPVHMMPAFAP